MKHKTLIALTILVISFIGSALVLNRLINQAEPQTEFRYEVKVAFHGLSFDRPVGMCHSGDGTNRLFVVGQMGLIYVFENHRNVAATNIFLDMRDRVFFG